MVLYSWLALRWAIDQFQREEVLFREAERLDIGLWLRRLFRDKEALPSAGQAVFCFVLILVLHWLSLGFGRRLPLLAHGGIRYLAFMAAPPLFMALLLTTRPQQGLACACRRGGRGQQRRCWPCCCCAAAGLAHCVGPANSSRGLKQLAPGAPPLAGTLQVGSRRSSSSSSCWRCCRRRARSWRSAASS